jgi:hypothetical protein
MKKLISIISGNKIPNVGELMLPTFIAYTYDPRHWYISESYSVDVQIFVGGWEKNLMEREFAGIQRQEPCILYDLHMLIILILLIYSRIAAPMIVPAEIVISLPFLFIDGELWHVSSISCCIC